MKASVNIALPVTRLFRYASLGLLLRFAFSSLRFLALPATHLIGPLTLRLLAASHHSHAVCSSRASSHPPPLTSPASFPKSCNPAVNCGISFNFVNAYTEAAVTGIP